MTEEHNHEEWKAKKEEQNATYKALQKKGEEQEGNFTQLAAQQASFKHAQVALTTKLGVSDADAFNLIKDAMKLGRSGKRGYLRMPKMVNLSKSSSLRSQRLWKIQATQEEEKHPALPKTAFLTKQILSLYTIFSTVCLNSTSLFQSMIMLQLMRSYSIDSMKPINCSTELLMLSTTLP